MAKKQETKFVAVNDGVKGYGETIEEAMQDCLESGCSTEIRNFEFYKLVPVKVSFQVVNED